MSAPAVSLLVCTYEQPRELALALAGLERQTWRDWDLWICDDGSGRDTTGVVEELWAGGRLPVPIHHVRHEHRGFRRASILNAALRRASGRLIVFMDGDCIPHHEFLRDHVESWEPGRYLAGRRVNLGEALSRSLTVEDVRQGFFDRPRWRLLRSVLSGETRHGHRAARIGSPRIRRLLWRSGKAGLVGSNFSVARDDLVAINGFDEAFEGYGFEDTELELRLERRRLVPRALRSIALQFHLWHPRRMDATANAQRMALAVRSTRTRCTLGIAHLAEPDVLDSEGSGVTFPGDTQAQET